MAMTPNSRLVLDYLKNNYGEEFTRGQIAEALSIPVNAASGSVNGLVRSKRATQREAKELDAKGKEVVVRYVTLTPEGLEFDPDAVTEKAPKKDA